MGVLAPGDQLGSYEVTAQIGAGGMGEVYRARDTRLKRDVALKVLPASNAADPDRLARFRREAELLATLNHPHIAAIYGFEHASSRESEPTIGAIVMEFVDGETLAERVQRGAIACEEALPLAGQIIDALEAAHERGVVHRDLKPANIKLTGEGQVKVLDFGLAKILNPAETLLGTANITTNSPTMLTGASVPGMILGTAAYMAPEQARGRPADKRADIWAFGCVLFEMLAGARPFDGVDVTEILGAVIHKEPDWSALPATTPRPVRRIIARCLQKDPRQRTRDVGDVRLELADAPHHETQAETAAPIAAPKAPVRSAIGWIAALIFGVAAGVISVFHFTERPPAPSDLMRFQVTPPSGVTFVSNPVISPDGRKIAIGARGDDGRVLLWLHSFDSLEAKPLAGTDRIFGAAVPGGQASFWSPDSRYIAFVADGRLKKVDVFGGPATTIAVLPTANTTAFRGGAWGRNDDIVFGTQGTGLWRVSSAGGTPKPLTQLREGEAVHGVPTFLPDGRRFLYARGALASDSAIYLGWLDTKPDPEGSVLLEATRSGAIYAPSLTTSTNGYLLFTRESTLLAQEFDARAGKIIGAPVAVVEGLGTSSSPPFSVSSTGVLVYRAAGEAETSRLVWFDRQGKQQAQLGPPAEYGDVYLSADGKTVVIRQTDVQTGTPHLWVVDPSRGVFSRLNPGTAFEVAPAVSSDGRVAFSSNPDGSLGDIYTRQASGVGEAELIVKSPIQKHPNHWSRDNKYLIYDEHHPTQQQDLWIVPMSGDRKPVPFLATRADETQGQFSPDGKWIAYRSDESGRQEVYVRDFAPNRMPAFGSGKWQVSTSGGTAPRWRPDGKELYYMAPNRKMMSVSIKPGPVFEPDAPVALFDMPAVTGFFPYDVSPDGRFLLNVSSAIVPVTSSPITVVVNWVRAIGKQ